MDNLNIFKIRKVKTPCRAHFDDAGIDFFVPEDLTFAQMKSKFETTSCQVAVSFADDKKTITSFHLAPGESILLPAGVKVAVPKGHALIFFNKSGIASKRHLLVGAAVVDESYTGEVHINLHNTGNMTVDINAGDKIVQGIVLPINYCTVAETFSEEECYKDKENSGRGSGGFGSSGTK